LGSDTSIGTRSNPGARTGKSGAVHEEEIVVVNFCIIKRGELNLTHESELYLNYIFNNKSFAIAMTFNDAAFLMNH
jgi:hypothetical protein